MDDKSLQDDLIIGLIFRGDSILYMKTGTKKNFPDFKMPHASTDAEKIDQLGKYIHDDLGLAPVSVELLGHIQKDPRDIMQYFINAHIYIYRVTLDPDQPVRPLSDKFEFGFHDPKSAQQDGFSYKAKLMLDFLKDWTIPDFKRLDARDIRNWYNTWLGRHLKNAYKEYIDAEIDKCQAEAECYAGEIGDMIKRVEPSEKEKLENEVDEVFKDSQQLADLIAHTADEIDHEKLAASSGGPSAKPDLQLSALDQIKNHLCNKLYGLKNSNLNEVEKRIAYRLMGHLLKRTNDLITKYESDGAKLEYDQELKRLVYELESESLSPFDIRRG